MKILISKETVESAATRKTFVAMVYSGLRGLLSDEKLTIEVVPDIDLTRVCGALRAIAGILDVGTDAIAGPPDDDDNDEEGKDDADFWKKK